MTWFEAIMLALVQGLTEFLPISSSAHLILPSQILGWSDQGLAFDVAVHVGTLLAIIIYFRREVFDLSQAWLKSVAGCEHTQNSQLAWLILLSTMPTGLAGVLFNDYISENLRSTAVIASTTIIFGLVLLLADRRGSRTLSIESMNIKSALIIGVSQAIALIPGTSRSGITMTTGLLLGYDRESSARFSFLLSIPVILGAGLLATLDLVAEPNAVDWSALAYGALFSFVSAYICISLFLTWINRIGMFPFVIYRLLLGAVLIFFIYI